MPKLSPIQAAKLQKILLDLGFVKRDAKGSHEFYKHADGRTTVIPANKEISVGLLKKILRDIEIDVPRYEKLRLK